ncbi:MAG: LysR family transcriptional regulator [Burkholderiales bacterium]|nr:LysR family transcriptional regulator [Burkholderiales bacterium]
MSDIVTFQRIRSFIAVAELGGFRKAAAHLSISQPALTAHVKALEDRLGVRLLRRTTRQAALTPEGQFFLERAQRGLGELNAAVEDLLQRAAAQRGRIVLGCTPSIACSVVPPALARFHRRYPQVKVALHDDRSEIIEQRLRAGELDLVVGPAPESTRDVEYTHLFEDPFLAIFPQGHALDADPRVALAELLHHDLIAIRSGLRMRTILKLALAREGHELKPVQEVSSQFTVCALVEAGLGVGMLPQLIVCALRRGNLRSARIVAPEITRRIGVTTRRGSPPHYAARTFVTFLREALKGS